METLRLRSALCARSIALGILSLLTACSSSSTGTIQGTVQVTDAKEASALVNIPGQSYLTGAGGTFTFASVAAGDVTVTATREGYTPVSQTVKVEGDKTANVTLTLTKVPVAPVIVSLTAVPSVVIPGGIVTLAALARSSDGYPLNYKWTVPQGWTVVGDETQATLALKAPAQFSQVAQVVLTVDNGHEASTNASVIVQTSANAAPTAEVLASPSNPQVGLPVTLSSWVSATNSQAVTYTWTLPVKPVGSSSTLSGTTEATTIFTPDVPGSYTAQLIVKDEAGLSSQPVTATVVVARQPPVVAISTTPSNPQVGVALQLASQVLAAPGAGVLKYDWKMLSQPTGSTALLTSNTNATTSFTPDVAGTYSVALVVTDSTGLSSEPAVATLNIGITAPVAAIAGSPSLSGSVNQPTLLDGSASTSSAGNPLSFTWSVTGWPMSSKCGTVSCFTAVGSNTTTKFTPDVAGAYGILLSVKDLVTNVTATDSVTVQVVGALQFALLGGSGQGAVARQFFNQAVTVQLLASDGRTPVPNVPLTWSASNLTFRQSSTTTDANGKATAVLQANRVAGPASARVFVTGTPAIAQAVNVTVLPDVPASFAVQSTVGNADTGAALVVKVVDQFGNATNANAAANTASLQLLLQSNSNKAAFGPATSGSIAVNGGNSQQAIVTLANGAFVGSLTDTAAETVQVLASRSAEAPLPFSAWSTQLIDGAETGASKWSISNTNGSAPVWAAQNTVVTDGAAAFGVAWTPAQQLATQESVLSLVSALPTAGSSVVLLSFQSNVQTNPAFDATNNCSAQTNFRVRLQNSAGTTTSAVVPVSGYELQNNCSTTASFGGTSNGWVTQTADLTDGLVGTTTYLAFQANNTPNANASAPTLPSSWSLDNVWVRYLSAPSFTGSTATVTILPGAATTVQFGPSTLASVAYGQCINGQAPYLLTLQVVDKNGNLATATPTVEVDWSGASQPLVPTLPITGANVVSLLQNGIQLQLKQGQVSVTIPSTASDTVTVSLNPLASGLLAGQTVTGTSLFLNCHSNGLGVSWSDTSPTSTITSAQAVRACETTYGLGNCTTNGSYAYPTLQGGSCRNGNVYGWSYIAWTPTSGGCGSTTAITAGRTSSINNLASGTCGCSNNLGQTSAITFTNSGTWN